MTTMRQIAWMIEAETGVTLAELRERCRDRVRVEARRRFMAEAYATRRFTMTQIGLFLGRERVTVWEGLGRRCRSAAMRGEGLPVIADDDVPAVPLESVAA